MRGDEWSPDLELAADPATEWTTLTVLRSVDSPPRAATKTLRFDRATGQWLKVKDEQDSEKRSKSPFGYRFQHQAVQVSSLDEVAELVARLAPDPYALLVLAAPSPHAIAHRNPQTGLFTGRRLIRDKDRDPLTLVTQPGRLVALDIDDWPVPAGLDYITDPDTAIQAAIVDRLPAEFHNVTCLWQLSASAGVARDRLRCHLYFWAAHNVTCDDLKRGFELHIAEQGRGDRVLDPSFFDPARSIFTAEPILEGDGPPPVPTRMGWFEGSQADVQLPDFSTLPAHRVSRGQRGQGRAAGVTKVRGSTAQQALAQVGDGEGLAGFHEALRTATYRFARKCHFEDSYPVTTRAEQDKLDVLTDAFIERCKDAIRNAPRDRVTHPDGYLEPYLQGDELRRYIEGAFVDIDSNPPKRESKADPSKTNLPVYYPGAPELHQPVAQWDDTQRATAQRMRNTIAEHLRTADQIFRIKQQAREQADGDIAALNIAKDAELRAGKTVGGNLEGIIQRDHLTRGQKRAVYRAALRKVIKAHGMASIPELPNLLVNAALGSGKTDVTVGTIAEFASGNGIIVHYVSPTVVKAFEALSDFNYARTPSSLPAMVMLGRNHEDPTADDGRAMCLRPDVVHKATQRGGISVWSTFCNGCPFADQCGSMRQVAQLNEMQKTGGLIIQTAPYLHYNSRIPTADILILDEAATLAMTEVYRFRPEQVSQPFPDHVNVLTAREREHANRVVDAFLTVLQTPAVRHAAGSETYQQSPESLRLIREQLNREELCLALDILEKALAADQQEMEQEIAQTKKSVGSVVAKKRLPVADQVREIDNAVAHTIDRNPTKPWTLARKLVKAVIREWDNPRSTFNGVVFHKDRTVVYQKGGEKHIEDRIHVHTLKRLKKVSKETSVLVLDGTSYQRISEKAAHLPSSFELAKQLFKVERYEQFAIEHNGFVITTSGSHNKGKSYSRRSLTGITYPDDPFAKEDAGKAIDADAAQLQVELGAIAGQLAEPLLVVGPKAAIEPPKEAATERKAAGGAMRSDVVKARGEKETSFANLGAVRGKNEWEEHEACLIVGREQIGVEAVEDYARCFAADDAAPFVSFANVTIPADWRWRHEWPFKATRRRRMRDGRIELAVVDVHPDPLCQVILEEIREAELLQAAFRLRPIRKAGKTMVLATNLALDITVDRVLTHKQLMAGGAWFDLEMQRTGLVPHCAADLYAAQKGSFKGMFTNANQARHTLERHPPVFSPLTGKGGLSVPHFPYKNILLMPNGALIPPEVFSNVTQFIGPGFRPCGLIVCFNYRLSRDKRKREVAAVDLERGVSARQMVEDLLGKLDFFEPVDPNLPKWLWAPEAHEMADRERFMKEINGMAENDVASQPTAPDPAPEPDTVWRQTWHQTGLLPVSKVFLHRAYPDRFKSEEIAKNRLENARKAGGIPLDDLPCSTEPRFAWFRVAGQRGSDCGVLIDPELYTGGEDAREALAELLGAEITQFVLLQQIPDGVVAGLSKPIPLPVALIAASSQLHVTLGKLSAQPRDTRVLRQLAALHGPVVAPPVPPH